MHFRSSSPSDSTVDQRVKEKNHSITYKKMSIPINCKVFFLEWLTIKTIRDLSRALLWCCETVISLYSKIKVIVLSLSRQRSSKQKQREMKCYSGYQITNDCLRLGLRQDKRRSIAWARALRALSLSIQALIDWTDYLFFPSDCACFMIIPFYQKSVNNWKAVGV